MAYVVLVSVQILIIWLMFLNLRRAPGWLADRPPVVLTVQDQETGPDRADELSRVRRIISRKRERGAQILTSLEEAAKRGLDADEIARDHGIDDWEQEVNEFLVSAFGVRTRDQILREPTDRVERFQYTGAQSGGLALRIDSPELGPEEGSLSGSGEEPSTLSDFSSLTYRPPPNLSEKLERLQKLYDEAGEKQLLDGFRFADWE